MTYSLVEKLDGYAGDARLYEHSKSGRIVMVSRAYTFDRGDETMIFKWGMASRSVMDWNELYAGYGETHEEALANYENEERS